MFSFFPQSKKWSHLTSDPFVMNTCSSVTGLCWVNWQAGRWTGYPAGLAQILSFSVEDLSPSGGEITAIRNWMPVLKCLTLPELQRNVDGWQWWKLRWWQLRCSRWCQNDWFNPLWSTVKASLSKVFLKLHLCCMKVFLPMAQSSSAPACRWRGVYIRGGCLYTI